MDDLNHTECIFCESNPCRCSKPSRQGVAGRAVKPGDSPDDHPDILIPINYDWTLEDEPGSTAD